MSYTLVGAWMELDVARHKTEFYRMWQVGYSAGLPHGRVFASMGAFDRSRTVEGMRRLLLEGAEQREALSDGVDRAPERQYATTRPSASDSALRIASILSREIPP